MQHSSIATGVRATEEEIIVEALRQCNLKESHCGAILRLMSIVVPSKLS